MAVNAKPPERLDFTDKKHNTILNILTNMATMVSFNCKGLFLKRKIATNAKTAMETFSINTKMLLASALNSMGGLVL